MRFLRPKRLAVFQQSVWIPVFGQVFPIRILGFNQSVLLFPAPAFDFLLSGYCCVDVCKLLEIDESMAFVLVGEIPTETVLVFLTCPQFPHGDLTTIQ